ncbi:hypothetical protein [Methylocystis heyeri]|uniref:Uncharacterized protein n=1 Tax=Methylocystis heyeri TaxID=391905 RepID=A0A6B8KCF9_9HYPH|nr:hypothetical protein [Methylocystis heyeri]QGM46114.1 hypothetical protein H2LOC_010645 [Methylocystis heyeri]
MANTNIQSKQIDKTLLAAVGIAGFNTSAANSDNISAALGTALATAGFAGGAVPLQAGAAPTAVSQKGTEGVEVGADNIVPVFLNGPSRVRATDRLGNDIYGKVTKVGAVYTLSYFSAPGGVEAAYTWAAATAVDLEIPYWFYFADIPADALMAITERHVNPAGGVTATPFSEALAVTALNTVASLTNTPRAGYPLWFTVNGVVVENGNGLSVTPPANAVTVDATATGLNYNIQSGVDVVYAHYSY